MKLLLTFVSVACVFFVSGQTKNYVSKVWVSDNGDGTFKNPILNADYSDPDAIRVGDDYYLVSSSFENIPGLPILHSKDLVNWTIIGHALIRQPPFEHFTVPRHGEGVWAPALRYHNGEFYLYYPDPDFGIYLLKSKKITGPWSQPIMVQAGKGLIDPCPLWDDNGKVYLAHAFAGSRAAMKSVIVVKQLNAEGTRVMDEGVLIFDGHESDPTVEGPKFYKRNGYYYIFAPAGGVGTGWQLVLRSKNIYGPYERRVVMDQGNSSINGPHQGAWVQTQTGEDWFLHFQDKEAYGRVVHLQPMKWVNDWPIIGIDKDGNGKGEPVLVYKKPGVGKSFPIITPIESDEFNAAVLGLQWQWAANPQPGWAFPNPSEGTLRLYAQKIGDSVNNYWQVPAILQQKFPAEEFMATVKLKFQPKLNDDKAGLMIFGSDYAYVSVIKNEDGLFVSFARCLEADKGNKEIETPVTKLESPVVYLRVKVSKSGICQFSFCQNGKDFIEIGGQFIAKPGRWTGSKLGIFCSRKALTNDAGFADVDWIRIEK